MIATTIGLLAWALQEFGRHIVESLRSDQPASLNRNRLHATVWTYESANDRISSRSTTIQKPMTSNETDADDNEMDTDQKTDQPGDWTVAETPTAKELRDVVQTANGPYAVGAEGTVLHRNNNIWETRIDTGPATKQSMLTAVDVTSDGNRIWFAGSSSV